MAAGPHHRHSNTGSGLHLLLMPQIWQRQILNQPSETMDGTRICMDTGQVFHPLNHIRNSNKNGGHRSCHELRGVDKESWGGGGNRKKGQPGGFLVVVMEGSSVLSVPMSISWFYYSFQGVTIGRNRGMEHRLSLHHFSQLPVNLQLSQNKKFK